MSQENVEIVRRSYEAYALGDIEGALAAIAPQIEIRDHDIPDASEYHGHEGMFRWRRTGSPVGRAGAGNPRSSSLLVIMLSRSSGSTPRDARAAWRLSALMARSGPCATARGFDSITTAARPRASKPWEYGSSRGEFR